MPQLLASGYAVRCLVRSPAKLEGRAWASDPRVEIRRTDLADAPSLTRELETCGAAFYLVHSMMSAGDEYAQRDRQLALAFGRAAHDARVGRVIYLGGLGETGSHLSKHLSSRRDVEGALASAGVPVTVLRAAMIIGSRLGVFRDSAVPRPPAASHDHTEVGEHSVPANRGPKRAHVPLRRLRDSRGRRRIRCFLLSQNRYAENSMNRMSYERYTSEELTHFVGQWRPTNDERYDLLLAIVREGRLKASGIPGAGGEAASGPTLSITGPGKISDETAVRGQIVCFCDIPLSGLGLHMEKYGSFGIAFRKPFLVTKGANPVFYVAKDSILPGNQLVPTGSGAPEIRRDITRAEIMDRIHAEALSLSTKTYEAVIRESCDQGFRDHLLRLDQLRLLLYQTALAFVKPFDSSEPEDSRNNYYMEREWRVYGDVLFTVHDVARIIVPAAYAEPFRGKFPDYGGELTPVP